MPVCCAVRLSYQCHSFAATIPSTALRAATCSSALIRPSFFNVTISCSLSRIVVVLARFAHTSWLFPWPPLHISLDPETVLVALTLPLLRYLNAEPNMQHYTTARVCHNKQLAKLTAARLHRSPPTRQGLLQLPKLSWPRTEFISGVLSNEKYLPTPGSPCTPLQRARCKTVVGCAEAPEAGHACTGARDRRRISQLSSQLDARGSCGSRDSRVPVDDWRKRSARETGWRRRVHASTCTYLPLEVPRVRALRAVAAASALCVPLRWCAGRACGWRRCLRHSLMARDRRL